MWEKESKTTKLNFFNGFVIILPLDIDFLCHEVVIPTVTLCNWEKTEP